MAQTERAWDKVMGEKYMNIRDVIEDCAAGKPVYINGSVAACDVILRSTVTAVLGMIERGQLYRCERVF